MGEIKGEALGVPLLDTVNMTSASPSKGSNQSLLLYRGIAREVGWQ